MRTTLTLLTFGLLISFLSCRQSDVRLNYSKINLCDSVKADFSPVYPTFSKKNLRDGQLNLSIRLLANCTIDYYGLFKTDNDTLKLFYIPKGFFPEEFRKGYIIQDGYIPEIKKEVKATLCDCYLEMTYKITGLKEIPKFIRINGERIRKDIYSE